MLAYATRGSVQDSLEIVSSSRSNAETDRALVAARLAVEGLLRRRFYPELKTVKFDWPNNNYSPSWTLRLDANEMVSLTALTAGGTNILSGAFLRRDDNLDEPPYNMLQIDTSSAYAFQSGTTFQRSIHVTGVFCGGPDTATSLASCSLGADINSSVSTVVLNPTAGVYNVDVGSLLLIGTERLSLVDRRMSDTGQNLQSNMDDIKSDRIVDVTDGTAFAVGEVLLLGAERMRITDIAGNNLIVDRAWDGTVLDDHTAPEDVYALRTFTVQRGVLGSTAAAHTAAGSTIYTHEYPALVSELNAAEAIVMLAQKSAAYARQAGSGANTRETVGQGIGDLRDLAVRQHGRYSRSGAV